MLVTAVVVILSLSVAKSELKNDSLNVYISGSCLIMLQFSNFHSTFHNFEKTLHVTMKYSSEIFAR